MLTIRVLLIGQSPRYHWSDSGPGKTVKHEQEPKLTRQKLYINRSITCDYLSEIVVLIDNASHGNTYALKAAVARAVPDL